MSNSFTSVMAQAMQLHASAVRLAFGLPKGGGTHPPPKVFSMSQFLHLE